MPSEIEIHRLLANGIIDTTFAAGGTLRVRAADYCSGGTCPFTLQTALALSTFADGRALLTVECAVSPPNYTRGTCAVSVGNNGSVEWIRTFPGFFQGVPTAALATLPDGSAVLAGTVPNGGSGTSFPALLKVLPSGDKDPLFGNGGLATFQIDHFRYIRQVAVAPDGRIVVSLIVDPPTTLPISTASTLFFIRTTATGILDPTWGSSGIVPVSVFDLSYRAGGFAIDTDLSVISAGSLQGQAAVLRLRPDGNRETKFGGAGIISFAFHGGSGANAVAIGPDGKIDIGGFQNVGIVIIYGGRTGTIPNPIRVPSPLVLRIRGGLDANEHPLLEAIAVEYLHRQFNHYFVTANGYEMGGLDLTADSPWVRTGRQFNVWFESAAHVSPACRFWSDQSFAPKSSHFYTPYADECTSLRAGNVWSYEGTAFWLGLPEAQGSCPAGSQPIYRAYNNGQGGAPNHRYSIDAAVLDAMLAQGWIAEGNGRTRVFACAPQSSK